MYKLITILGQTNSVGRLADNAFVPFDVQNTDFVRFKQDIADGAELQDADGVVMTAEQVQEFLANLT